MISTSFYRAVDPTLICYHRYVQQPTLNCNTAHGSCVQFPGCRLLRSGPTIRIRIRIRIMPDRALEHVYTKLRHTCYISPKPSSFISSFRQRQSRLHPHPRGNCFVRLSVCLLVSVSSCELPLIFAVSPAAPLQLSPSRFISVFPRFLIETSKVCYFAGRNLFSWNQAKAQRNSSRAYGVLAQPLW